MTTALIVLWVYIVLLFLGGLMGFIKAGSKASLIASTIFAVILILFATGVLPFAHNWVVLAFLAAFFAYRWGKSKKMMPNGMMVILTFVALVLQFAL